MPDNDGTAHSKPKLVSIITPVVNIEMHRIPFSRVPFPQGFHPRVQILAPSLMSRCALVEISNMLMNGK
jgi:hypothetical protein